METNLTKVTKIGSLETTYYAKVGDNTVEVPQEIVENFMAFLTAIKELKPSYASIEAIDGKGTFKIEI